MNDLVVSPCSNTNVPQTGTKSTRGGGSRQDRVIVHRDPALAAIGRRTTIVAVPAFSGTTTVGEAN